MSVVKFVSKLRKLKVQVWLENDALRYQAPQGVMTPELLAELKMRRRELINFLYQVNTYSAIEPAPERKDYPPGCYPASSTQKRFYILNQMKGARTRYNISGATRIEGKLDPKRLEETFQKLVQRHEAFRTSFAFINGELVQRIHPEVELTVDYQESEESRLPEMINGFIQPFDLSRPPLLRLKSIKVAPENHILLFDMHHIISDGVSMGILMRDFVDLYHGEILPELTVQYKDFAAWQNGLDPNMKQSQERFWLKRFGGEIPKLNLLTDYPRPAAPSFEGDRIRFEFEPDFLQKLNQYAVKTNTTLYMLLLAAYNILLAKYSGQEDIIIGSPVAGRPHPDLENIIGVFINTLAMRNYPAAGKTFGEFLAEVRENTLNAYQNQDYQFEELVAKLHLDRDVSRGPLFDAVFILQNMPRSGMERSGLKFTPYELDLKTVQCDLTLETFEADGKLVNTFEYSTKLFTGETIGRFIDSFGLILRTLLENPSEPIAAIELLTTAEKQKILAGFKPAIKLAVSATFTAEPIKEHIAWWLGQFREPVTIEFAPYNQVFQELLNPSSLFAANPDLNLLLVRFEDWLRDDPAPPELLPAKLEQNFTELAAAFRNRNHQAVYLVALFPVSNAFDENPPVMAKLTELTTRWRQEIVASEQAYPVDLQSMATDYEITEIYDPVKDRVGHLPFSDGYYAALGAVIARKIISWKRQPFKVIVLDCDNTLWQGVCGEDGAMGVKVLEPYAALQRLLLQHCREGMLLALCSKNNEADVWDVFAANPGMILRKEDLVGWRINWQPKAENLKALARELNLGLDSFIFIDDNPMECAAVMASCPEVLTLRLPEEPRWFAGFLKHVWAFDRLRVTTEDQQRTRMYQEEKQRRELQTESLSLTDFLQKLELKVSLTFMEPSQISRVAQMTYRTNQFNLSTIRRTEAEIQALTMDPRIKLWVVEVADRFGAYGLTGVVITKEEPPALVLDTMLLSCRVLGKNVEEAVLSGLQRYGRERKLRVISARYFHTSKNEPFLKFLERTGWERQETTPEYGAYRLATDQILERMAPLEFYYQKPIRTQIETEASVVKTKFVKAVSTREPAVGPASGEPFESWEVESVPGTGLLHQSYLLPLQYHTARLLLQLPVMAPTGAGAGETGVKRADYVAPRNELETKLAAIWQEVLKKGKVGIHDNFFHIGGHSLNAMQAIAKLTGFQLELSDIFQHPTIAELSQWIQAVGKTAENTLEIVDETVVINNDLPSDKFLDEIEPFNEIFYQSCFYNAAFPVIRYFHREIDAVLAHDVFVYDYDDQKPGMKLGVKYIPTQKIENLLAEMDMEVKMKGACPDVIPQITTAISQYRPVIIFVDCFYLPLRQDTYQKMHWPHSILVYGYEQPNQMFHIVDHDDIQSLNYQKKPIHFHDLANAHRGYLSNFQKGQPTPSYFEFNSFSGARVRTHQRAHDRQIEHGNYSLVLLDNLAANQNIIKNGFDNINLFKSDLIKVFADHSLLNTWIDSFIFGMNEIIKAKNAERYRIARLISRCPEALRLLDSVIDEWNLIKGMLEKYKLTNIARNSSFEKTIMKLDRIYRLENQSNQAMIDIQNGWARSI